MMELKLKHEGTLKKNLDIYSGLRYHLNRTASIVFFKKIL